MNKKALFLILLGVVLISPFVVHAEGSDKLCTFVSSVRNLSLTVGGSIVAIGWVIAGILYLTSAGSPEKTGTAKKALIACVIGTILVVISVSAGQIIQDALKTEQGINLCV